LILTACGGGSDQISLEDEYAFRTLRENFHTAVTNGDRAFLRSLFADDATLTYGGETFVGADAIADAIANDPEFGERLLITLESNWKATTGDGAIEFGFDSVSVHTGGTDPTNTDLALLGAQNPDVEIVEHTHTVGEAVRVDDTQWKFQNVTIELGPLPSDSAGDPLGNGRASSTVEDPSIEAEVGFRRMREKFHLAALIGSTEMLRDVWAEDGVFSGGGNVVVGRDAIVEFMSSTPEFGTTLTLTPEDSVRLRVVGNVAEFALECIWISVVGVEHPEQICLCDENGSQNALAQIFRHTHATGTAVRLADGRWVIREFNGGAGPLPPESD
jgi:hypothetical protein